MTDGTFVVEKSMHENQFIFSRLDKGILEIDEEVAKKLLRKYIKKSMSKNQCDFDWDDIIFQKSGDGTRMRLVLKEKENTNDEKKYGFFKRLFRRDKCTA